MTQIANAMNQLFDLLTAPFGGSAALAVAVLSALTGVVMLLLFKWSTNQDQLVAARQVLTGRVYEMGLFQDHLSILARIQKDLAVANFKYLRWSLPALLVVLPPMIFIFAQMDARYGHRPLSPGEVSLVTATLASDLPGDQAALLDGLRLEADPGVLVETNPLRDPGRGQVRWRVRVQKPGDHLLTVHLPDGGSVQKLLAAGTGYPRLAQTREKEGWLRVLFNPGEKPLAGTSPLKSIALTLPERRLDYGLFQTSWLMALIIFSLVAGLALKNAFGVRM